MSVERYSHVMHIVSTVVGDAAPGPHRVRRAGGHASRPARCPGRPSRARWSSSTSWSPPGAGLYGGVVGYLDFAGDLDMAIAIRTALIADGVAYVQAGGGIVADSVAGRSTRSRSTRPRPSCGRWPPPRRSRAHFRPGRDVSAGDREDIGRDHRGGRGERLLAAGAVAAGAALMLLAVTRTWAHAVVQDTLVGRLSVDATGRQAAPVVAAVALVALAGAVAVLTLRTVGRFVAGLLLVLLAGAAAAAALGVLRTPSAALQSVLTETTGRSGDALPVAQETSWPWVAVAGAVLVLVGGAVAVARARRWSGLSAKYDAPVTVGAPPTRRPPRPAGPDVGEPGADVPAEVGGETDTSAEADPWDRLSRGEDPTA